MKTIIKRRSKQASKPVRLRNGGGQNTGKPIRKRNVNAHFAQQTNEELQSLQTPPCIEVHTLTSRGEKEYQKETHSVTHADREVLLGIKPTIENARIDRVNAKYKSDVIVCHLDDSQLIKVYAGGQPKYTLEAKYAGELDPKRELESYSKFCEPSKIWNETYENKIRKSNMVIDNQEYDTPLVSGKSTYSRILTLAPYTAFEVLYDINLNPTRAVNQTNCFSQFAVQQYKNRILGKTQPLLDHAPLRSLNNSNNLIPFEVTDAQYEEAEENYFIAVIDALEDELKRVCDIPSIELASPKIESITFKEVEVYWDIELENAPAFQKRIMPHLKAFGKSVQEREHGQDERLEKNQKSLTIYINKQERIRIYAKAPNRIRFEIVSLLKNVSQWLSGGKVRKNKAGVLRLIQQVKRKSTERINELLRYLLEATAEPTPEIIASDPAYVHTWANRFKNDPIAKQVLELLIANSRLVTGQSLNSISESVSAIIRKAQYHKLLVRKGKTLHACLPCQKNFTPELTQNQIKLINETQIETQTVSGSDEFVANTRVLERGRRIPPPPPFFLALRADYYELFWGLLFLMRDIKISTLGMEWLSCVYVR